MVARMSAPPKSAGTEPEMTVDEFFAWAEETDGLWRRVDGVPVAMSPFTRAHGAIQGELRRLIADDLLEKGAPCSVVTAPGVILHVNANKNVRAPDAAVVCGGYVTEEIALTEPVVVLEILSPDDKRRTWANVWSCTTMPSVKEIVVFQSQSIEAKLSRRAPDGRSSKEPETSESGDVALESIGVRFPLVSAYRTTRLA